MNLFLESW